MRAKEQAALAEIQRRGRGVDCGVLDPLIAVLVQARYESYMHTLCMSSYIFICYMSTLYIYSGLRRTGPLRAVLVQVR
jgi:hypothetical protein